MWFYNKERIEKFCTVAAKKASNIKDSARQLKSSEIENLAAKIQCKINSIPNKSPRKKETRKTFYEVKRESFLLADFVEGYNGCHREEISTEPLYKLIYRTAKIGSELGCNDV
jgi:hypothetical protein